MTRNQRILESVYVATGGALGALARTGVEYLLPGPTLEQVQFPWGTFAVNLLGSFLLGFTIAYSECCNDRPSWLKPFVGIGFCGSFTTFSSATAEFILLDRLQDPATAYAYVIASLAFGLMLASLGRRLALTVTSPKEPPC